MRDRQTTLVLTLPLYFYSNLLLFSACRYFSFIFLPFLNFYCLGMATPQISLSIPRASYSLAAFLCVLTLLLSTTMNFESQEYEILNKAGEGTFSEVIKAKARTDGKMYAVKRMKGKFSSIEQVDKLREVQALRRLRNHPNIIQMEEIILYVRIHGWTAYTFTCLILYFLLVSNCVHVCIRSILA